MYAIGRVATAQGIWFLLFPDRENTGKIFIWDIKQTDVGRGVILKSK